MSSDVSSLPSDELVNLLVQEIGAANGTRVAGEDSQKGQHANAQDAAAAAAAVVQPQRSVKPEPPYSDDHDSEPNSSIVSTASNHRGWSIAIHFNDQAIVKATSSQIVYPARSIDHNAQLPAPTVGRPPGTIDSRQSEPRDPQTILAGPTKGRRSNRVTDQSSAMAMCDVCGQCFARTSHLTSHLTIHTGEKPHECSVCGRRFRKLQNAKVHMMSHTGERPFVCEHCGQGHRTAVHLARHKLVHTGEKPHACQLCPKRYYDVSALRQHERSHTGERPFACDHCDKRFLRSTHLRRHELCHSSAEPPYCCSICGQRVATAYSLKQHTLRRHSTESRKNHYCDECGDAFSNRYSLKVHVGRAHAEKSGVSK